MTEERNTNDGHSKEQEIDLPGLLFKYLFYWKWFVVSVLVCCAAAWLYIRYQPPVYNITSSVLIKEDGEKSSKGSNPFSAVQDMGMFSMTNNFDNEVEILKSRTLIKKVVRALGLYIDVVEKRVLGYSLPLYKNSPLLVYMTPEEAERLEGPLRLDLQYGRGGLEVVAKYWQHDEKESMQQHFDSLPAVFPTPAGVVSISAGDSSLLSGKAFELAVQISPPINTAECYAGNMSVFPSSKTTTIAGVSLKNTVKARGVDFINYLIKFYNQDANDEKNEVAQKTADFIQERIGIINAELGHTESRLASFKQRSGLTDLKSDAGLALQESSKYEQMRIENATQIRLVQLLRNYIDAPANAEEVLPVNVGLQDQNLSSLIDKYNTMLIERNRLLRTSSESNPAVIRINTGIDAMRRNVRTTVNSVLKGLEITRADIARQASKFEGRISQAPAQEKEFVSISRQQEIQAALYIMLLQKREENAITLASTANNGRIIEETLAAPLPVAPKKSLIFLAAFIIGLALPVGGVFIADLLRYKIENRADVEALTTVPVIGELPLGSPHGEQGNIVVRENRNDLMEETFRALRTNLLFMLGKNERVILITSTQPGEGKSFVSANLAVSLAYMGKKTLIIGMDIRKPGLNKIFGMHMKINGITNYLNDPEGTDLSQLIRTSHISPNLDIIWKGPTPPNPTELLAGEALEQAIALLKKSYDYIVIDTAPIAQVTDTLLISRIADIGVYVCRADVTPKAAFCYVNVLHGEHRFRKMAVVINSIDMSKRKHFYGYGYHVKYGYGYHSKYTEENNEK